MYLERVWINQPSTSQKHHALHGTRVLYSSMDKRVWFLEGSVVSQEIDPSVLSKGWPTTEPERST
jgi:hypothetical protein